jgi:nucleotide-binding universal stress UspA family protein
MKSILVPVDFTPLSNSAIIAAASIAEKTGAKVVLLHNVLRYTPWDPEIEATQSQPAARKREAENGLRALLNSGLLRPLNCQALITEGITDDEIVTKAHNLKVELIVMGCHGDDTAGKHFVDSTIQKVMRRAPAPVILINKDMPELHWKRMLVPASFNESLESAFDKIFTLAKSLDSIVHLLYVNMPDKFKDTPVIREQMNRFAKRINKGLKVEMGVYNHHELETAILEYASENSCDYIGMVTHDHRRDARYLISTTETIGYHSRVPVLSVPVRKKHAVEVM